MDCMVPIDLTLGRWSGGARIRSSRSFSATLEGLASEVQEVQGHSLLRSKFENDLGNLRPFCCCLF